MTSTALNRALAAINAGRLDEARQLLKGLLQKSSGNLDALYLLAVTEQASQNHQASLDLYDQLLAAHPRHEGAHYNKALLLSCLGRHEDALPHHDQAVRLAPRNFWALVNRGNSLAALKRHEKAIADYDQALKIQPGLPDALTNKGNALMELGQLEPAIACHDQALQLRSTDARTWNNRSGALARARRFEDALDSAERAIAMAPDNAEAWCRKSIALTELVRPQEALGCVDRALELQPQFAQAWSARGDALTALNRHADALTCYDRCISLDAEFAQAWSNKASALDDLGRDQEAHDCYARALAIEPGNADFSWNLAVLLIKQGALASGWELFEQRWGISHSEKKWIATRRPLWDGQRSDRPLLLWGEQGIGDQILYASILPELANLPRKKYVALDRRLLPLFQRSMPGFEFIDLAQVDDALDFAEHLPLGSLPRHFRPSLASFAAARHPYLQADPARTAALREKIARPGKLVCGVSWSSNRKSIGGQKSLGLAQLLTPMASDQLHFVDLQYGDTAPERQALAHEKGIKVQHLDEVDNFQDLDGLAALIQACDWVVTTSNTTAHLAGALGKQTLLLLPLGKGRLWYWVEHGGSNSWYPSIRSFSQVQPGDWSTPLRDLKDFMARTASR